MEFTIENNLLKVSVGTKGGELTRVVDKATGADLLWTGVPEVWPFQAPMMFPFCSSLKDNQFSYKGIEYHYDTKHGFARFMEFSLVEQTETSIALKLEANAVTMEKYPFPFTFVATYRLEGNVLHHDITVTNDGDETMIFSAGYHPGFMCPFDANHTSSDYSVVFEVPETPMVVEMGETSGLATGRLVPYFENQTTIALNEHIFDKDSICFTGLKSKTMSLVENNTGKRVTIGIEGFPYVLIWSKPGPLHFVCMEPWHGVPDTEAASGEWTEKPSMVHLAAGQTWATSLPMQFQR